MSRAAAVALALALGSCVRVPVGAPDRAPQRVPDRGARTRASGGEVARVNASDRIVRVAIATAAAEARISANGEYRLLTAGGRTLAAGIAGQVWRVASHEGGVRAIRGDGVPTAGSEPRILIRAFGSGQLTLDGRSYRGELMVTPSVGGMLVVNQLRMDDYLKGVVPLELGQTRTMSEIAAVEAQAVAARSYAYTRLRAGGEFDLRATVADQVYGGSSVETTVGNRAVENTSGLVLQFRGVPVNAPYSATCGGTTARASDVWRSGDEPYLQRVSDRIPGSDSFYCGTSPRFRWTATIERATLDAAVARYLGTLTTVPPGGVGRVRSVSVTGRTPAGRVATMALVTDRGVYTVRGNDTRTILRGAGGGILNSTYFSLKQATGVDGVVERLTVEGSGHGHGVGLCQWGAIGRARAGQQFREILGAYFPGTNVARVD